MAAQVFKWKIKYKHTGNFLGAKGLVEKHTDALFSEQTARPYVKASVIKQDIFSKCKVDWDLVESDFMVEGGYL